MTTLRKPHGTMTVELDCPCGCALTVECSWAGRSAAIPYASTLEVDVERMWCEDANCTKYEAQRSALEEEAIAQAWWALGDR